MGFNGEIKGISLPDVIQMACLEGTERVMVIRSDHQQGRIYFAGGEIVHAETAQKKGVEAFYEMMTWPSGVFELAAGRCGEKTIDMPWNFLLIESLRQADEVKGKSGQVSSGENRLKILLVDDSRVALNALKRVINRIHPDHEILEARNGKEALEEIRRERPDFVCLDASMPIMDGDVTLMHIMVRSPAPVALVSGLDKSKVEEIMDFFRLGAVDFLKKPGPEGDWTEIETRLRRLLELVPELKVHQVRRARRPRIPASKSTLGLEAQGIVVVLGGLGGILELQKMIGAIANHCMDKLAFVVIQDMSTALIDPLCAYIDRHSGLRSRVPSNGQRVCAGEIYINNWDFAWDIQAGRFRRGLTQDKGLGAINAFLASCARQYGSRLVVLILTGTDSGVGAGLEEVVSYGAHLLVQSPKTCLHPNPVLAIEALDLDEGHFDTEGLQSILDKFFPV